MELYCCAKASISGSYSLLIPKTLFGNSPGLSIKFSTIKYKLTHKKILEFEE